MNLIDTPFNIIWANDESYVPDMAQSKDKYTASVTAAGGVQNFTVPSTSKKWIAFIETSKSFHVFFAVNATAELPVGATFALSTSELIPSLSLALREVDAGDTLSFITADTSVDVSVSLYAYED